MVRVLLLEADSGNLAYIDDILRDSCDDYEIKYLSQTERLKVQLTDFEPDVVIFEYEGTERIEQQVSKAKESNGDISLAIVLGEEQLADFLRNGTYRKSVNSVLIREQRDTHSYILKRELEFSQQKKDIAERKHSEQLLKATTDITTSLLEINTLEEIARLVINKIIQHFHFEDCVIYEVHEDVGTLTQVAASGPKEGIANFVKDPLTLEMGKGIVGFTAMHGRSVRINDVSSDPRYVVDDAERNSELAVPILLDGKAIGVIDSEHSQKHYYSDQDLKNLEAVASVIATKFHSAQIHSEKEDAQQKLQESLDEKVVLLSEVHHRVKNNLAIISGLLHLQSKESDHDGLQEVLMGMSNRIQSIAGVHELLYNSDSFADITFDKYVNNLLATISSTFENSSKIRFKVDIDKELKININQAVPLGLLLNELVTNSFKYAFNDIAKPEIIFSLHKKGGQISGEYHDNGPGFLPSDLEDPKTLGFSLIKALFDQLEAQVSYNQERVYPLQFGFTSTHLGSHSSLNGI